MTHDCQGCRAYELLIEDAWNRCFQTAYPGAAVAMGFIRFRLGMASRAREEALEDAVIAAAVRMAHDLLKRVLANPTLTSRIFEQGNYSAGNAIAMLEALCFCLNHQDESVHVRRLLQEMDVLVKAADAAMETVQ